MFVCVRACEGEPGWVSRFYVLLCCSMYCLCVNVYCTTATGCQGVNPIAVNKYININIATRLCTARFGFRFPAVGKDHRSPVQTVTGAQPAFYSVGTDGSFDGGNAVGA